MGSHSGDQASEAPSRALPDAQGTASMDGALARPDPAPSLLQADVLGAPDPRHALQHDPSFVSEPLPGRALAGNQGVRPQRTKSAVSLRQHARKLQPTQEVQHKVEVATRSKSMGRARRGANFLSLLSAATIFQQHAFEPPLWRSGVTTSRPTTRTTTPSSATSSTRPTPSRRTRPATVDEDPWPLLQETETGDLESDYDWELADA